MNKKLMTMLVACALSVTTLSTTAVFAVDAVGTEEGTPAVTETTNTNTTTTKKEAPKTGDTMNVALYASLLLVSALAAVVLTTKKRITE